MYLRQLRTNRDMDLLKTAIEDYWWNFRIFRVVAMHITRVVWEGFALVLQKKQFLTCNTLLC